MFRIAATLITLAAALTAHAQTASTGSGQAWPAKPVRMVVPFPAGGTSDILARMIGPRLTEVWGPQIIVDNRPGANGNIGGEMVARAAPDGYTMILMDVGNLAISPSVFAKMPFDILKDFAPVTMVSYSPHLLSTHPSLPVRSVKELITFTRARPGKLNVPVGLGGAPQFAAMSFATRTGLDWVYLPTKGGGAASVMAVAVGEGDVLFLGMLQSLPHVKNGKLRMLAVSSAQRDPAVPETPTIAETPGLEGFVTGSWQGILAPANTPPDIVNKMNAEVARILKLPDLREKLASQGTMPMTSTPQEMGQWLAAEKERWAKLVKQTGFKLE